MKVIIGVVDQLHLYRSSITMCTGYAFPKFMVEGLVLCAFPKFMVEGLVLCISPKFMVEVLVTWTELVFRYNLTPIINR